MPNHEQLIKLAPYLLGMVASLALGLLLLSTHTPPHAEAQSSSCWASGTTWDSSFSLADYGLSEDPDGTGHRFYGTFRNSGAVQYNNTTVIDMAWQITFIKDSSTAIQTGWSIPYTSSSATYLTIPIGTHKVYTNVPSTDANGNTVYTIENLPPGSEVTNLQALVRKRVTSESRTTTYIDCISVRTLSDVEVPGTIEQLSPTPTNTPERGSVCDGPNDLPCNLKCSGLEGGHTLLITWDHPRRKPLHYDLIYWEHDYYGSASRVSQPPDATRMTASGITPDRQYHVCLRTDYGRRDKGEWAEVDCFIQAGPPETATPIPEPTPTEVVLPPAPSTPSGFECEARSPTSIRLNWDTPPATDQITYYQLNYTHAAVPRQTTISSQQTSVRLTDLEPETPYEFTIAAYGNGGQSDAASARCTTSPSPLPPTATPTATSTPRPRDTATPRPTPTVHLFARLDPDPTDARFTADRGRFKTFTVRTSYPRGVRVVLDPDRTIYGNPKLDFGVGPNPPSQTGCPSDTRHTRRLTDGTQLHLEACIHGITTIQLIPWHHEVSNLPAIETYTIAIQGPAPTSTPTPNPSNPISSTQPVGQPTNLSCSAHNTNDRINLTWTPPEGLTAIQSYTLNYHPTSNPLNPTIVSGVIEQPTNVSRLTPGTQYSFQVKAINNIVGDSAYTAEVRCTTRTTTLIVSDPQARLIPNPEQEYFTDRKNNWKEFIVQSNVDVKLRLNNTFDIRLQSQRNQLCDSRPNLDTEVRQNQSSILITGCSIGDSRIELLRATTNELLSTYNITVNDRNIPDPSRPPDSQPPDSHLPTGPEATQTAIAVQTAQAGNQITGPQATQTAIAIQTAEALFQQTPTPPEATQTAIAVQTAQAIASATPTHEYHLQLVNSAGNPISNPNPSRPHQFSVPENAGSDIYYIKLNKEPTEDMTFVTKSSDESVAYLLDPAHRTASRIKTQALSHTFTSANWNTPIPITIIIQEDHIDNPRNARAAIITSAHTLETDNSLRVRWTARDDDTRGLLLYSGSNPLTTLREDFSFWEDDDAFPYYLTLGSEPQEGDVTITVEASNSIIVQLATTASGTFNDSLTLVFSKAAGAGRLLWNTIQTIYIRPTQDNVATTQEGSLIHTASGSDYTGILEYIPLLKLDDDTAGGVIPGTDSPLPAPEQLRAPRPQSSQSSSSASDTNSTPTALTATRDTDDPTSVLILWPAYDGEGFRDYTVVIKDGGRIAGMSRPLTNRASTTYTHPSPASHMNYAAPLDPQKTYTVILETWTTTGSTPQESLTLPPTPEPTSRNSLPDALPPNPQALPTRRSHIAASRTSSPLQT